MARQALAQQPLPLISILLVEDNPSDAFLVDSIMTDIRQARYKTTHVTKQADAIAALEGGGFDVCLLDLTLPDASGFSALIEIQEKCPDLPVLILTGMNDMAVAKRAVGRGAQDYLLKDEMEANSLGRAVDYAMERKRLEKELFQRANCDTLTGLANRAMFTSRLGMALARSERSGAGVAVLFIDLDRFKQINDKHGHDAGDETLKAVAERIKSVLRFYDTSARFGGDEFAVLLEGIVSPRDAATIAQKIIAMLSSPVLYHGHRLEVGASIGIAFSEGPMVSEELLQYADVAMYYAKKETGSAYRFYTKSMQDEVSARLGLEEELRTAFGAKQLRLYYQPYVTPGSDAVIGVEALLRWMHPERGMLSAHEFLPAAETLRLMPHITDWMCRQLQQDINAWKAQKLPPLHIAVNLSVSQLEAPDIFDKFAPIAHPVFLGSHRLAVEVPEEAVSQLTQPLFTTLARLSDMGIDLHLDHFGRSNLSLSALHSLPFSLLKLDISLVKNMSSEASGDVLIRTAIMLAHHLGMKAGAVGVEELWQTNALLAQSCDVMQGFLTMPPMTAEQFAGWVRKSAK